MPVHLFRDIDEQTQIVNDIVKNTLLTLNWLERSHLRALEWSLNEIIDNTLTHSESEVGGAVQVSVHPRTKDIEFVVSDAGIGIPNSLRTAFPHIDSDVLALDYAIQEGVTRGTGQGNGLFGSSQISALSGGRFHINSGNAFLLVSRNGDSRREIQSHAICGSTVLCTINASRPLLLESALKIGGNPFNPADTLEIEYDTDDQIVLFNLVNEAKSFGSRMEGSRLRKRLETLLRSFPDRIVIIEANGDGIFSSSFADELFAKLTLDLEEKNQRHRLVMRNIAPINQMLISRSIEQRRRENAKKAPLS
jgi:anti-sigma regulatory factor (Ser/Thr protein kinase)